MCFRTVFPAVSLSTAVTVHDENTSFWKGGSRCQIEPCPSSLVLLSRAPFSLFGCLQTAH